MGMRGDHWLLRAQSSQLFFISSITVFAVGLFIFALSVLHRNGGLRDADRSSLFIGVCLVAACMAVLACFYLFVGMLWYWVGFDTSPRALKLCWLASFFILGF